MSAVKVGKLISGEIIVGQENEEKEMLEKAYLLNIVPDQNSQGQFNIIFLPLFIPISRDAVNVPYDRLITIADAPESLVSEYTRINSDIVIPTAGQTSQILRGPINQPKYPTNIPPSK